MLPPINFKILRDAVASDRVAVSLRWEDPAEDYPVSEYVIRFVGYGLLFFVNDYSIGMWYFAA